jgi:DNA mismatch repair ATPase MutS
MSHRVSHGAGMPDVERLTRKLERHKTSLSDLCQLYRASSKLPMIQAALLDHPGPHAELLRTRSVLHASAAARSLLCPIHVATVLDDHMHQTSS